MLEIDGSVILPKIVFEASGHLSSLGGSHRPVYQLRHKNPSGQVHFRKDWIAD